MEGWRNFLNERQTGTLGTQVSSLVKSADKLQFSTGEKRAALPDQMSVDEFLRPFQETSGFKKELIDLFERVIKPLLAHLMEETPENKRIARANKKIARLVYNGIVRLYNEKHKPSFSDEEKVKIESNLETLQKIVTGKDF